MALEIPQSDRIYNQEPLPEGFNPDDPRQVNADWIMRMFDKIVNGEYAMKSFKTYSNFTDLPNTAEQGETAYIEEDAYKNNIFIYNGSSWIMAGSGGNVIVDSSLSTTSTNPVQNKVITSRINEVAAAIPIIDTTLSPTSTNAIQNKVVTQAIQTLLPSQTGNDGKFLTTNGTTMSWTKIELIPDQTDQVGKVLGTNGEQLEWVEQIKPNLFDIKTISEPIVQKGWCCISDDTQKKLNKADVPTAYAFIKDKLDNADGPLDSWYFSPTTEEYNDITFLKLDNTCLISKSGYLYKSAKEDVNDITKWVNLNLPQIYTELSSYSNIIFGNNIIVYGSLNQTAVILNKNFEKIAEITVVENENVSMVGYADGYIYLKCPYDTYRIPDTTNISQLVAEFVNHEYEWDNQKCIARILGKIDNKFIFNKYNYQTGIYTPYIATDIMDSSTYQEYQSSSYGYFTGNIGNKIISNYFGQTNTTIWSTKDFINVEILIDFSTYDLTLFTTYNTININKIFNTDDNQFVICLDDSNNHFLYLKTKDFKNFLKLIETTTLYLDFCSIKDLTTCNCDDLGYATNNMTIIPTVYIDTINGTDIKYYKNDDWKICTPDIAVGNDTNLQTVYEFLGYLNYWWIDTTNEQITFQRNSNLWTMMYVGYDYEDDELPSGNYRKNKIVNELIEIDNASITIDVKGNQFYKFTNNAITDITIDSCEDSIEETTIKFTTGNSAPTLTDNANLVWYNGIPTLLVNTSYTIVIVDKTAYYQEN